MFYIKCQWFLTMVMEYSHLCAFCNFTNQTHLNLCISSLVETQRPKMSVSDKSDFKNVGGTQGRLKITRGPCITVGPSTPENLFYFINFLAS